MNVTLENRLKYHPDPEEWVRGRTLTKSDRRVAARLDAIRDKVDLTGKSLLDIGCSGGFFGFATSLVSQRYLGIDADDSLIARNAAAAERLGLGHLTFRSEQITPDLIRRLPHFDVALFLSVFHHILAASEAYEWNDGVTWDPMEILSALAERADVLIFETGYPDEGMEWCARLPDMSPSPAAWVESVLRASGFKSVERLPPPHFQGVGGRALLTTSKFVSALGRHSNRIGTALARVLRLDPRDRRDIFIARRF